MKHKHHKETQDLGMQYPEGLTHTQYKYCMTQCVDCGGEYRAMTGHVRSGKSTRCCQCSATHRGKGRIKHGDSKTKLWNTLQNMKARCLNKNSNSYQYYGGRGITICDEWLNSYPKFKAWATARGYADDLTIDRIDNDAGYSPDNCRWVDMTVQNRNTQVSIATRYTLKECQNMVQEYRAGEVGYKEFAVSQGIAHGTFSKFLKGDYRGAR